jgi:hypothetical protein
LPQRSKPEKLSISRETCSGNGQPTTVGLPLGRQSALAGLEAAVRLIDDIDAPLTPHDAVITVTAAQ